MNPHPPPSEQPWDAIVIGGALSGAATALLLLRRNPRLRVLIVERHSTFKRRVGESTVEVSAYFLGRVLDLTAHLNEHHYVKQGLRFWFHNPRATTLGECSETGPGYNVRLPGYQVDRAVLDEEVLARAVAAGASLLRPARVLDVSLNPGGLQTVTWETPSASTATSSSANAATSPLLGRWVIDASGFSALLARRQNWLRPNPAHPTAAVWTRWSGVKNWDSRDLAVKFPAWSRRTKALRHTATNHLVGLGWWAWMIPLKGGDTSVGVVYDQRLLDLPEGERLGPRLREMLFAHPAARELMAGAVWRPNDTHFRRNLAYHSTRYAGDGFVLVGDAAAFIDPFYSPGMDWIAYTASAAAALIDGSVRGKPKAPRIELHNTRFAASYARWFDAVYRDKYYYLGDHQLMTLAFRLDLGLYYLGVVSQPFRNGAAALETPSFASRTSAPFARFMAFYNRRLAAIARTRLARGTWGQSNDRRYCGFRSYELTWTLPLRLLVAVGAYLRLEFCEGWRCWFATPHTSPAPPEATTSTSAVCAPSPL
ncbi:MAG: tryptophan 7-halogenase [Verrucomicrobia bacterium]|nr:tryptophan 7-halogenase [Verrucomicrobiota bacterium]